jgi:DNA-binding NarL/FixJ family response regulator
MALRILLADDCPLVHESVGSLLAREPFEIIGTAADGEEAVRLAVDRRPDIVILDQSMPMMTGLAAARVLRQALPDAALILLTLSLTEHQLAMAFDAGFHACVLKKDADDDLVRAINDVARGVTFVSSSIARMLLEPYLPAARCDT